MYSTHSYSSDEQNCYDHVKIKEELHINEPI